MRSSTCDVNTGARRLMLAALAAAARSGRRRAPPRLGRIQARRSDDRRHPRTRSRAARSPAKDVVQAYLERVKRLQRRLHGARHAATASRFPRRRAPSRAGCAARCSRPRPSPPRAFCRASTQYDGHAARVRHDGSDRFGSEREAAVRHGRRHSECRTAQRVRNAEHPRRAFGHLQGQLSTRRPGTPLPKGAPPECEKFRQQPDALERAAELDAQYGSNPDLDEDADVLRRHHGEELVRREGHALDRRQRRELRDGRAAAGHDRRRAAARQRARSSTGITIASEVNFNKTGDIKPKTSFVGGNAIRSSWGGAACNPYDTERTPGGSSGGAGASVAANLATCSICETTGGSCRIPANANSVASFVTTKGLTSEAGSCDRRLHQPPPRRAVPHARRRGARDRRDEGSRGRLLRLARHLHRAAARARRRTSRSRAIIVEKRAAPTTSRSRACASASCASSWSSIRRTTRRSATASTRSSRPCCATAWAPSSSKPSTRLIPTTRNVPNTTYTFADAFAEILPISAPEYFFQKTEDGKLEFAVPGYDVTTRDYLVKLSLLPGAAIAEDQPAQHLARARQHRPQRVHDREIPGRARRHAHARTWRSTRRTRSGAPSSRPSARRTSRPRTCRTLRATEGIDRVKMHTMFRYAMMKVMRENDIDVLVHPNVGLPLGKIGRAQDPNVEGRGGSGFGITDLLGVPEIVVPAGFNDVVYEPQFVLSEDKKSYTSSGRHDGVEGVASAALQHRVLGRARRRARDAEDRLGVRGGDASPQAAGCVSGIERRDLGDAERLRPRRRRALRDRNGAGGAQRCGCVRVAPIGYLRRAFLPRSRSRRGGCARGRRRKCCRRSAATNRSPPPRHSRPAR